jgi:DNA-binding NtrC family response regulator
VIQLDSTPGKGSVFTVSFPAIDTGIREEKKSPKILTPIGHECVLFVDDEPFQTEIGKALLERLGYDIVTANSSSGALKLFNEKPNRFDLVITDYSMPGMSGIILSKSIHETNPKLPIILCTGFSDQLTQENMNVSGIKALIMKPYLMKDFATIIRHILDESKS